MIDDKNFLKILLYAKILIGPESVSENFQTRIQTRTRSGPGSGPTRRALLVSLRVW